MRVLAVGKAKATAPEAALFTRYAGRLKPDLTLQELPDGSGGPAEIKRREAVAILAAIPVGEFVVVLDAGGVPADSVAFARLLEGWRETARRLTFVIGGAEGLDRAVLDRADATLSFGVLTWPHMLVRAMLAEQIYRARMIAANHPYHRAGRP